MQDCCFGNENNLVRVNAGETVSKPVYEPATPPCWVFLQCEASKERKATVCCVCTVWVGLLLLTCLWSLPYPKEASTINCGLKP